MLLYFRRGYLKRVIRMNALRKGLFGGSRLWRTIWFFGIVRGFWAKISKRGAGPVAFSESLDEGEAWAIVHVPEKSPRGRGEGRRLLIGPKRKPPRTSAIAAEGIMHAGRRIVEAPDPSLPESADADWVDLVSESASISAPDIHGSLTSVRVRTGLWRTVRPVIDLERCHRCHWVCSTLCPDGAIAVLSDGAPEIDYDHCKGCMICVAVCPTHAITSLPESQARREEEAQS